MLVKINDKQTEVPDSLTIQGLLDLKELPPGGVVVEVNGMVVCSDKWQNVVLKQDDQIEVVRYVGGG